MARGVVKVKEREEEKRSEGPDRFAPALFGVQGRCLCWHRFIAGGYMRQILLRAFAAEDADVPFAHVKRERHEPSFLLFSRSAAISLPSQRMSDELIQLRIRDLGITV